jgi:uncharacterized membrane protein YbhN (UPF0104 family)
MRGYTRWLPRLLGPAILAFFLLTTDVRQIVANLRGLRWLPLLVSLALYPIFVVVKAWRWNLLLRNLKLRAPPLRLSIVLYMIGLFAAGATPGQSGDFVKAWYLRERGEPLAPALLSVLLDRLFDLLVMALLSVPGLIALHALLPEPLRGPVQAITIALAATVALAIAMLMARRPRDWLLTQAIRLLPRPARAPLERWRVQFAGLGLRVGLAGTLVLATLAAVPATMIRLWLLFRALNIAVPIAPLVSSMALISIVQSLPISFSGLGVRDAVLIPVLASYGYGAEQALALSALFLLVNVENVVIGFVVSLRHPLGRSLSAEAAPARAASG